jgi:hypothetical protein
MTDGHYPRYKEMLEKVVWENYGVVDGVARDSRCENCMVHCGYDPSGALGTNYRKGDNWKNFRYNFASKPAPYSRGDEVNAFNGFSIGKGHLAEAKKAINARESGLKGAASAFQSRESGAEPNAAGGGGCASGDTSQRDALLAKISRNDS